jgi:hypothetical protein
MMISRVEFNGAAAHAEVHGAVLVVKFGGLLMAESLAAVKSGVVRQMRGSPRAVLADYSGAVLALNDAQLDDMMSGDGPEQLYHLPAAVVAPRGGGQALQAAALRAAVHHGALRSVAPDLAGGMVLAHRLLDLAAAMRPGTPRP